MIWLIIEQTSATLAVDISFLSTHFVSSCFICFRRTHLFSHSHPTQHWCCDHWFVEWLNEIRCAISEFEENARSVVSFKSTTPLNVRKMCLFVCSIIVITTGSAARWMRGRATRKSVSDSDPVNLSNDSNAIHHIIVIDTELRQLIFNRDNRRLNKSSSCHLTS